MKGGLSLLLKPVSADCNMRCQYCFYLRATDPYRSSTGHIMDDLTLRTMISGYMKSSRRCASFGWQGGEPLLAGLDFFKRVVAYQAHYGQPGQLVSNNLQTNGTLLDEAWARFFQQYNFFLGVSLDGPEEYHNRYRYFTDGKGSFNRTMTGIGILRTHQVDFSVLTVINNVTAEKPDELYNFFIRNGLHYLQFIPCVESERSTGKMREYSVGADQYGDFLCVLFDVWYNRGKPLVSIRLFENVLAIFMGLEPEICAFKNRCGSYAVIEYNGDVYPCDFFVENQWLSGNLLKSPIDELFQNQRLQTFHDAKIRQSSDCQACEWNFICHFGCQHYRLANGKNYLCTAYKQFYRYTHKRFRKLADIMAKRH